MALGTAISLLLHGLHFIFIYRGARMNLGPLDIQMPGLVDLILDFPNMSLWELLRRYTKPLSVAQIAKWTDSNPTTVRNGLDRLIEFGLVERVDACGSSKTSTFRTTPQKLVVTWSADDPKDKALAQRLVQRLKDYNAELFEDGSLQNRAYKKGDWIKFYCTPVGLNAADLAELRRRIGEVVSFVNMIIDTPAYESRNAGKSGGVLVGANAGANAGAFTQPPPLCNYNVSIRVQPLHHPVAPQPNISIVPRVAATQAPAPGSESQLGSSSKLSHREKQIAVALGSGRTQHAIAQQLGLSPFTVGTFTKRIYRKLGVHSRVELLNIMRGRPME